MEKKRSRPVVLVASPDHEARERWKMALRSSFSVRDRGGKTSLGEMLRTLKPAVLLLDLTLRRLGGLQRLPSIQSLSPSTKIILLTGAPKLREEIYALKLGAKGYCSKNLSNELLRKAVWVVQSGEVWSGRKVIPNLLEEVAALKGGNRSRSTPKPAVSLDQLTSRKKEVARLVAEGASNRDIAQTLRISEATVKAYLTDSLKKLQLSSRLNLAVLIASQKTRVVGLGLFALVTSLAQEI